MSYAYIIILGILTLVPTLLNLHLSFRPLNPESTEDRGVFATIRTLITVFCLLAIGVGCAQWYDGERSEETKAIAAGSAIDDVRRTVVVSSNKSRKEMEKRFDAITNSQAVLARKQDALTDELATNSLISPELRVRIVQTGREYQDLESEISGVSVRERLEKGLKTQMQLEQIQEDKERSSQLITARNSWDTNYVYYDTAVRTLMKYAADVAHEKGDKAQSDFKYLPGEIAFDVENTNLARVRFENHTNWVFDVVAEKRDFGSQRRVLSIICPAAKLRITPFDDGQHVDTYITPTVGKPLNNLIRFPDEKSKITWAVEALVHLEIYGSITNTSAPPATSASRAGP